MRSLIQLAVLACGITSATGSCTSTVCDPVEDMAKDVCRGLDSGCLQCQCRAQNMDCVLYDADKNRCTCSGSS